MSTPRIPRIEGYDVRMLIALFVLPMLQTPPAPKVGPGPWHAVLASPTGPLPFELVLRREDGHLAAAIRNGAESVDVPDTRMEWTARTSDEGPSWQLVLDFPHYDAQIRASLESDGAKLSGEWRKRSGPDRWTTLPFHAEAGAAPRFGVPAGAVDEGARVLGRWKVQFQKDTQPAVAVFEAGTSAIDGTLLTPTGDFRYLSGAFAADRLRLSCFDGAHAFLIDGMLQSDGTLKGTFSSGDAWTDTWTAVRDADAKLPDEMAHAHWNDAFGLAQLQYADLDGSLVNLGDARFAGQVRILQVTGSWCPNCHDETDLLAKMERAYRGKGLSIVALCFELTGEEARDSEQAHRLLARHDARYLGLLCGRSDRELAQQALPALDRVFAFPMTVFLHRDGRVRAVHAGFSGPATGAEHEKLRARFTSIVDELLAEPKPKPSIEEAEVAGELWRDERARTFTSFERDKDGTLRFTALEMTRFDGPTRTDPVDSGVATIDGTTVRLGSTILHFDARARVMLDASDVGHRYTPATRSPFPYLDATGYSEMPQILAGLSSTDATFRRESVFYLALQIVQDRMKPPEMGGGQLDPGLGVNLLASCADPDPQVRATAAWAVGVVGLEKAVPMLVKDLDHGFAPVRREAARALGRLKQTAVQARLGTMAVQDVDPLVRNCAAESAEALRPK
jgi:thiol-disulfide isomerase/thioredoxin